MLCCFDSFGDPTKAYERQTGDRGVSSFPGQRRFQSTGGNALSAAPHMTSDASNCAMIAVTVPHGVSPGQTIQVNSPDGRIVDAQVPQGMSPGSQFIISMPHRSVTPPASAPIQDYSGIQAMSPPQSHFNNSQVRPISPPMEPFVPAVPVNAAPGATTIPANSVMPSPSSYARDIPIAQATPYMTSAVAMPVLGGPDSTQQYTSSQKLLRVQVPPGMAPGSTIHVQVPGENRTIAAQIPYGVTEFHVAYDDASAPQAFMPSSSYTATIPASSYAATPYNHHAPQAQPQPQAPPGQKLVLVRVPPGTSPGTVLHVSIPDEPGRIVSAVVPPHVSEFHVSYVPHNNQNNYSNGNYRQQQRNNNHYDNMNNNNNGRGGMGGLLLPIIGGAALGAAGLGMYHQYEQQEQQHDNSDQDNYNDYGGGGATDTYGGGNDYGGGDDYGGFGGDY